MPWNRTVIGLAITNFLLVFGGGGIITGGNVWALHAWGKSNGPFMQILSFSYGIGAFIAPLIAEPFFGTILKNYYL
jgi:FHS family Na+ dependent glucose MFS transporter 1